MDFQSLKRRDLQSLCKKNHIPANLTNAAMIDALASLSLVEGLEEFLGKPESEAQGSPERSVITSPTVPPTTTRRKALKEEVENSKLATRTCCGTKIKAKEGIDTRKTPATRTTRKRACQEASVKKEMEKNLQADFEADLNQSEVSEDSVLGGELKDISEEVSGDSLENEGQLSENQTEAQNELQQSNDEQDVIDVDDLVVNEVQEESSESKVDFHSLTRKDLQNLCKKNKIPANMTNAAMADALASLETVEGLQEFLKDSHSEALRSPQAQGVATSCARRSRTTLKITKEEPPSSKLVTKSCRGSRRRILEEDEPVKNDVPETPVGSALFERESNQKKEESAVPSCELKQLDNSSMDAKECPAVLSNGEVEDTEVSGVGELSSNINNSKDNVLNVDNLQEPQGLVVKMDETTIEESSKDAEVFIVDGDSSRDGEVEIDQVQNSRTFEIDADSESEDSNLEDLVSASALAAADHISKEDISESSTHIDQLLDSEFKEHINSEGSSSRNSKFENVVTVAVEVGSHAEDEISEKSHSMSNAQADKLSQDSSGESESDDSCTEDMSNNSDDSDFESESEGSYSEEEMSEKSDSEITTQAKNAPEITVESESDGSCTEDDMRDNFDSKLESESSFTEEDISMKSDIETTTQGDKLPQINVESEVEDSCTKEDQDTNVDNDFEEKQISMKFDIETASQDDKLPETNAESELEGSCTEDEKFNPESTEDQDNDVDIVTTAADLCAPSEKNQLEKVEITIDLAKYDDVVSNNIDIETTQAEFCARRGQETPLKFKSLRKLKRILKEKLQAAVLTQSMESLTLEECKKPIAEVEEDLHGVPVKLSEDFQESEGGPNDALQGNRKDEPLSNDPVDDSSEKGAIQSNVNATILFPVDILVDNEVIPEDDITGDIDVVACPPQLTPTKFSSNIKKQPSLFTPPSKKPMSAGKKNCVLDVNKENIVDSAASKTEPGKIKVAITESVQLFSAMSMGKLKNEFKVLQQSEKKRQALQSRSENNCLLTSP